MKMMKKLIAMLLALVLVFACAACGNKNETPKNDNQAAVPNATEAPNSQEEKQEEMQNQPSAGPVSEATLRAAAETPASEFTYAMSSDYEGILIQAYNGSSDVVVIPATIDGQPVVDIAEYCFANGSPVRAVMIPETVIEIGELFTNNESLEVVIAEGVQIVGEATFLNCAALKTIVIGNNLKEIGEGAFAGCPVLEKLTIPATVTEIDEDITFSIFMGSDALTVYGEAGSFIEGFCALVGVPFVAE